MNPAIPWDQGAVEETSDRDGDGVIDAVDDLRDLIDGWRDVDGTPRCGLRQLGDGVVEGRSGTSAAGGAGGAGGGAQRPP